MSRSTWTRPAAVLPLALAVVLAGGAAYAAARAQARGVQPVAVTSFGAQPSTSATASTQSGPLVLTYVDNDRIPRMLYLRNTGGLPLTGQTWTLSLVNTAGGTKGDGSLSTCSTGYTAAGDCSGTVQTFLNATEGTPATVTTSFPVPVGGAVAVKFTPSAQIRGYTATFGSTVSRAQTGPASTPSSS